MVYSSDYLKTIKQDIIFDAYLLEQNMRFYSTWGLFSPREIDNGSYLLLKHITIKPDDRVLDLGCGYGPLGLTIAKLVPQGQVYLVDKDFIAIEYCKKNIIANQLQNCETFLSNGFSHVKAKDLSLVVSNLPAKVGKELLYCFLYDAKAHMQDQGRIYVVTITGLRRFIERAFEEVFGNYDKVKQGKDYTVAMAVK